jgi:hypothetical protein
MISFAVCIICAGYVWIQLRLFGTLREAEAAMRLLFWKNLIELAASSTSLGLLIRRGHHRGEVSALVLATSLVCIGKLVDLFSLFRDALRRGAIELTVLLGGGFAILYIAIALSCIPLFARQLLGGSRQ